MTPTNLTPDLTLIHDLFADADDPDPVPCHWRTGGPFRLAGDIRNRPHDWDAEVTTAARRMATLAPPPLSGAERRRCQHEERRG